MNSQTTPDVVAVTPARVDLSALQPIVDKLLQPGEMSSEYKAFRAMNLEAKITALIGLAIIIAGFIPHLIPGNAVISSSVGTAITLMSQVKLLIGATSYNSGRVAVKTAAAALVTPPSEK